MKTIGRKKWLLMDDLNKTNIDKRKKGFLSCFILTLIFIVILFIFYHVTIDDYKKNLI